MQITYFLGVCRWPSPSAPPLLHHAELWQKQRNAPSASLPLKRHKGNSARQCPRNRFTIRQREDDVAVGLPVMTSARQELFSLSQCRALLVWSVTGNHSTTNPPVARSAGAVQRTSKLLSLSGVAVIFIGSCVSTQKYGRRVQRIKHTHHCMFHVLFLLVPVVLNRRFHHEMMSWWLTRTGKKTCGECDYTNRVNAYKEKL